MKKVFSTVAMAIVAFTAVVSMSSCQNDSPSSFNAAPQVPATTTPAPTTTTSSVEKNTTTDRDYAYQATINSDVLDYFDITITLTNGSEHKDYTFTQAEKIGSTPVMMTEKITFKSDAQGVSFNATVTPKANWKEVADANGLKRLAKCIRLTYTYKGIPGSFYGDPMAYTVFTDESMETIAGAIAANLSFDGSDKLMKN